MANPRDIATPRREIELHAETVGDGPNGDVLKELVAESAGIKAMGGNHLGGQKGNTGARGSGPNRHNRRRADVDTD